jgi:hypothetical protein
VTVIWVLPNGRIYVTTPGSALLFPSLCVPTGGLPPVVPTPDDRCGNRDAMVPLLKTTRAHHIATERRHDRQDRQAERRERQAAYFGPAPPGDSDDEPPPF